MFTSTIFHLLVKLNLQIKMHLPIMLQFFIHSGFQFLARTTGFPWKRSSPSDHQLVVKWVLLSLGKSEQCTTLSTHFHVQLWKTSITVQIPMYMQVTQPLIYFKCSALFVFISNVFHLSIKLKPYNKMCILFNGSTYHAPNFETILLFYAA
jgi:hypothetical protein